MANRYDAVVKIDEALDRLEQALQMIDQMGATYSLCNRLYNKISQLNDLRVDIMQADLLQEDE